MPCQVDFERSTDHTKLWPSYRIAYIARSCELQEPTLSASFHPHIFRMHTHCDVSVTPLQSK